MGHKALSKVQLGREATAGTAVSATFVWRGPFGGLQDARETMMVEEDIAIALPSSRSYNSSLAGSWSMPATELTPEHALHIFEAGIKAATPVADGDSSGYLHAYAFPTTSLNTIKTYSIQSGDETQAELMNYGFVSSFTVTGNRKEALKISSEWVGRTVVDGSFTALSSFDPVSFIHASTGTLFIDDTDGDFGDTGVARGNLLEFTLNVTTGQKALFTVDTGQLYFQEVYFDKGEFSAEMELKFLADTAGIAERTKWRSNTERLVRLEFTGDDYGTEGTTGEFTTKAFRIDFPGTWQNFSAVEFDEGKSVFTAKLQGGYSSVSGDVLTLTVANETASL